MDHRRLQIEHLDSKMAVFAPRKDVAIPAKGWVYAIRTSIGMTLRQLGTRMGITRQSVKELENREAAGTITLNTLGEAARALDMHLVVGFVPRTGTLVEMVQEQAYQQAKEIVSRTSTSMSLEDQENSKDRLLRATEEKAAELLREMPRFLWD